MKSPLRKRIPRELKGEIGKYLVVFILMVATIGMVSGFLVADGSMIQAYDEGFEKYNIEDGNFRTGERLYRGQREAIEEEGVKIYENYYIEDSLSNGSTMRFFKNRTEVDKVCLMDGELPSETGEIAIDRMYADNNLLNIGDTLDDGTKSWTITGLVALSDYSCLFQNNNDSMFDAVKFGVGIVTDEEFDSLDQDKLQYNYAWTYNEKPQTELEEKNVSEDLMKAMGKVVTLENFVPQYQNQAIIFTGDDMGSDKAMMIMLLYIIIVIMAFVFGITTSNTIAKEAGVIGTLRASGYTKNELIRHYMTLPVIVTLVGALIGNILGYTAFKDVCAGMYYGSYSLPTYVTIWNAEAFLMTTVVPVIIMFVVNYAVLLPSALDHYQLEIQNNMLAKYQYMLSMPVSVMGGSNKLESMLDMLLFAHDAETDNEDAEEFSAYSLNTLPTKYKSEEVTLYGVHDDSKYIDVDFSDGVSISKAYADKFLLKPGDSITLKEKYEDDEYTFKISGIYDYNGSLCIFMPQEELNQTFDLGDDYFSGYFSNSEITDIDSSYIGSVIDLDALTKISRQLNVSMGSMMGMVNLFAVAIYMILIYLLSKIIIEKNAQSISMTKILGYTNGEISRLYILSTSIVVVLCLLISLPIETTIMEVLFREMMLQSISGWIALWIDPMIYVQMFVIGLVTYAVVALLEYKKIRKVPMGEALKNAE